jgi:hypothetical protein
MGLANIRVDNADGLARSCMLCYSRYKSGFTGISGAENQTGAFSH